VPKRLNAKKTDKVLRGVQPNAGIEAAYRAKMQAVCTENLIRVEDVMESPKRAE
jgi:hypothetical protein